MKSLAGNNVLTVLLSKSDDKYQTKAFFCPYTQNITVTYQGEVKAIMPGFDPEESPQVMIKPLRTAYTENIHYTFVNTFATKEKITDFWIQDQYFMDLPIKTYFCFNCHVEQLYFSSNKVVHFDSKADIKKGERFTCRNPLCKQQLAYQGIVKIVDASAHLSC